MEVQRSGLYAVAFSFFSLSLFPLRLSRREESNQYQLSLSFFPSVLSYGESLVVVARKERERVRERREREIPRQRQNNIPWGKTETFSCHWFSTRAPNVAVDSAAAAAAAATAKKKRKKQK